jgi:hypothetical protein
MAQEFLGTQSSEETELLPRHQAVSYGSVDVVKGLLGQKGLNLGIENREVSTPLHLAFKTNAR